MKQLNTTFKDETFESLESVKGSRTWREAIVEEFGVSGDE